MKYQQILKVAIVSTLFIASGQVFADSHALKMEAKKIIKEYVSTLQPALKKALNEGGAAHAVEVCTTKSPEINQSLSKKTGWNITRVSLKTRNPDAKPDAFEQKVLQDFDRRQAAGEDPVKMMHAQKVGNEFRVLKAMGVAGLCLTCHGEKVEPKVKAMLKKYYPNDKALGYSIGQIRGAISLSKTLK